MKPIVIRSKSLSIDDSFSRMIDEWARRSKICRVECIEYTSCPRKSSEMNFGLYIVRITSCSTRDDLSAGTFCAVSRCSRM